MFFSFNNSKFKENLEKMFSTVMFHLNWDETRAQKLDKYWKTSVIRIKLNGNWTWCRAKKKYLVAEKKSILLYETVVYTIAHQPILAFNENGKKIMKILMNNKRISVS